MKALVYHGPGKKSLDERPMPQLVSATDAIVKVTRTTICGTDLHILKGDVPTCRPGRILGHEGVGIVHQVGAAVSSLKEGDHVLISCISSCGKCDYCRRGMYSHCTTGGWILGHRIDGTQAEYVRIPHAETSLYPIPAGADEEALVMLSDILPTGFECGVLNGKVQPGSTVAIVGAGPIGLAALLTAQFYSPAQIIMIDRDEHRLEVASRFGATACIDNRVADPVAEVMKLTDQVGVDCAIEAVGVPETFELCEALIAPGGVIANVGVHGVQGRSASGIAVGSQHLHYDAPRRYRQHADAAEDGARRPPRSGQADHAPLPARRGVERLRNLRPRGGFARVESDYRNALGAALLPERRGSRRLLQHT